MNRRRVLMVSATPSMIWSFNMRNLAILQDLGCEVAVATNTESEEAMSRDANAEFQHALAEMGITCHHVGFERGRGTRGGISGAVRALRELQRRERFHVLHTHQPGSSAACRWALRGRVPTILYTAHGFHFTRGGPKRDWLLYFPVEERLSAFTDVLFTVNEEDEALARRRMHAGKVVRLPGVGIDWSAFQRSVAAGVVTQLRLALGVAPDERLLLSVGELNPGKNHASVIRAMARLGAPGLHYVVCGVGPEAGRLSDLARGLGLSRQVHLVGFQGDVRPYLAAADAAVHVSRREGLGVFGLEALASGLPLIGSDVRGIRDYMDGGRSGYLVRDPLDVGDIARGISAVMATPGPGRSEIASHNRSLARGYDRAKVDEIMRREYALAIESARSG